MVKTIFAMVIGSALIGAAHGVTLSPRDESAREGAIQWLQLIDTGHYEDAASQASLEAQPWQQWLNYFKTQRAPLGRAHKRELVDAKHTSIFPSVPDVRRYYILRFRTWFERKPAAIEEITIAKMSCCWEIYEYKITDK